MVARMQRNRDIGLCGSTLLFYEKPTHVQALGGAYYCRWLAAAWHLGQRRRFVRTEHPEAVERHLSYVVGASMLVSIEFLRTVGLMAEDYFLYSEEMDWVLRAGNRFKKAYAPESIVYHKVGSSIGTRSHPGQKSLLCDYYNLRNRLIFTRRHFPYALPTVYLGLLLEGLLRLIFGQWRRMRMVLCLIFSGKELPPLSHFEDSAAR
jgi:GT2 family glycosyltransferase